MSKCNDFWCERYNANEGNCAECVKNDEEKDRPELRVILKRRAVKLMELDKISKTNGQSR